MCYCKHSNQWISWFFSRARISLRQKIHSLKVLQDALLQILTSHKWLLQFRCSGVYQAKDIPNAVQTHALHLRWQINIHNNQLETLRKICQNMGFQRLCPYTGESESEKIRILAYFTQWKTWLRRLAAQIWISAYCVRRSSTSKSFSYFQI